MSYLIEIPFTRAGVSLIASYSSRGLFNFAQSALPLLLKSVDSSPQPPTLIVTGATASIRGSKLWSVIAAGKSAGRILTQSLAREFGPAGVHVAHAIIDGGIDVPDAEHAARNDGTPDGKLSPYAVSYPGHLLLRLDVNLLQDC
jgi:NAD(P)-dependent dehydrogenase (short-subunit alcohol dehydrogenase family)